MYTGMLLLLFGLVFLSGSALVAFYWAARTGQFRDLHNSAKVIFDEQEPVGGATDCFPDSKSRRRMQAAQAKHASLP